MVHLLLLVYSWGNIKAWWRSTHYYLIVELVMSHISWMLFSSWLSLKLCISISSWGYNRWIFHPVLVLSIDTTTSSIRRYDWSNIMSSRNTTDPTLPALLCTILTLPWLNTSISISHPRVVLSINLISFVNWWNWQSIYSFNSLAIKSISSIHLVFCILILNLLISLIHYR